MRIHQLPIGAHFEYQGLEYEKTGPMLGTCSAGQRLIPKHAVLKPLGAVEAPRAAARNETVLRADVLSAFDTFYARCNRLVAEDERGTLEAARTRFLEDLDE